MNTWIALLRGINVGGNNILPMKDLKALCESLGFKDVQTYIQSGNCVFRSDTADATTVSSLLEGAIEEGFGFRPPVLAVTEGDLTSAIATNPYPDGDPKCVQLFFLFEPASTADLTTLQGLKASSEQFELTDKVFYLHAPDGIGRSKLVAKVDKFIPVEKTARNLRTALKLQEMAGTLSS